MPEKLPIPAYPEQGSTPATPSAGFLLIYPKSDGKFYLLNDAGVERLLTTSEEAVLLEVSDTIKVPTSLSGSPGDPDRVLTLDVSRLVAMEDMTVVTIDAVGDSIPLTTNFIGLDPNAAYTLTSTPTIPDGTYDGQPLWIANLADPVTESTFTLALQAESVLAGSNLHRSTTVYPGGINQVVWSETVGAWLTTDYSLSQAMIAYAGFIDGLRAASIGAGTTFVMHDLAQAMAFGG